MVIILKKLSHYPCKSKTKHMCQYAPAFYASFKPLYTSIWFFYFQVHFCGNPNENWTTPRRRPRRHFFRRWPCLERRWERRWDQNGVIYGTPQRQKIFRRSNGVNTGVDASPTPKMSKKWAKAAQRRSNAIFSALASFQRVSKWFHSRRVSNVLCLVEAAALHCRNFVAPPSSVLVHGLVQSGGVLSVLWFVYIPDSHLWPLTGESVSGILVGVGYFEG